MKKKRGRIKIDKSELLTDIRLEVVRDNSLTQVALKNIFEEKDVSMSLSTVNREVAASGLTRKRTKKRPNVVLSDEHRTKVSRFASEMEALLDHRILFFIRPINMGIVCLIQMPLITTLVIVEEMHRYAQF